MKHFSTAAFPKEKNGLNVFNKSHKILWTTFNTHQKQKQRKTHKSANEHNTVTVNTNTVTAASLIRLRAKKIIIMTPTMLEIMYSNCY